MHLVSKARRTLKLLLFAFLIFPAGLCNADPQKELTYKAALAEIEIDQIIVDLKEPTDLSELTELVIKADSLVENYKSALTKIIDERLIRERGIDSLEEDVVEAIKLDEEERNAYGLELTEHSPATKSLIESLNEAVIQKNRAVEITISKDKGLIRLSTKRDFIKKYVNSRIENM